MIEGLKLKVPAAELKRHCEDRAAHHRRRADTKEQELPKLQASLEAMRPDANPTSISFSNKASQYRMDPNDAVDRLKEDIADHRRKALTFVFFAEHLFDEDYTLMETDLARLELLK